MFRAYARRLALGVVVLVVGVLGVVSPVATSQADAATIGLRYCKAHNVVLRVGSYGSCVKAAETFLLYENDYNTAPMTSPFCNPEYDIPRTRNPITLDKSFTTGTKAAVKCFQNEVNLRLSIKAKYGVSTWATVYLAVDGIIGQNTYGQMLKACGSSIRYRTPSGSAGYLRDTWFCKY